MNNSVWLRVGLYGIAFGSVSACALAIFYFNKLYLSASNSAIMMIFNVGIIGLGVWLFIKAISRIPTAKPINMGKALFLTLCMTLIAALCNTGTYSFIYNNKPAVFKQYETTYLDRVKQDLNKRLDPTKDKAEIEKQFKNAQLNVRDLIKPAKFSFTQISMFLSMAFVVALISFLFKMKKTGTQQLN